MYIRFVPLILLALASITALAGDDDCDFDQKAQVEWLETFASTKSGAQLNREERSVTFVDKAIGTVTLSRGGCAHFGIRISVALLRPEPLTNREAIELGLDLLRTYDSEGTAKEFRSYLAAYNFELTDRSSTLDIAIAKDPFGEMSLRYERGQTPAVLTVADGQ